MQTRLRVATPEGESGTLVAQDGDYLFRYQDAASARAAVSLLMPVRLDDYRRRELHPIFQMNLPEGYVLEQLRNRMAKLVSWIPWRCWRFPGERLGKILAWDGTVSLSG